MVKLFANSGDTDQTSHSVASDQGLHLLVTLLRVSLLQWVKKKIYLSFQSVVQVMTALEQVFKLSFRKGDNSIPNHTPQVCSLHASAISAWSLLLSIAPQHLIDKMAEE